jgi:hypothetical protein
MHVTLERIPQGVVQCALSAKKDTPLIRVRNHHVTHAQLVTSVALDHRAALLVISVTMQQRLAMLFVKHVYQDASLTAVVRQCVNNVNVESTLMPLVHQCAPLVAMELSPASLVLPSAFHVYLAFRTCSIRLYKPSSAKLVLPARLPQVDLPASIVLLVGHPPRMARSVAIRALLEQLRVRRGFQSARIAQWEGLRPVEARWSVKPAQMER